MSKVMLKSKKGKKGSDEAEEYPLMSTAPIVQEGSQIQNTTAIPPVVMMSSSNAADMTITSKADKKSRKRSKAVSEREISMSALMDYLNVHGHCNVPPGTVYECVISGVGEDGADFIYKGDLGNWLHQEKLRLRTRKSSKIIEERKFFEQLAADGRLDFDIHDKGDSGFPAACKQPYLDWHLNYKALIQYSHEHGHCNVPQKDNYECDLPGQGEGGSNYHYFGRLGRWLDNQRQFKKNNKLPAEREAQIQILVDEGKMYWDASSLSASGKFKVLGGHDWLRHYAALVEYGKEHGHCNVPQKSPYECDVPQDNVTGDAFHYNGKLGRWLDNQRQFKKVHGGKLTTDREALLQILVDEGKLGWGVGDDSSKRTYQMDLVWPKHYAALLEYGREFGHCNVRQKETYQCVLPGLGRNGADYTYDGKLGRWLANQRRFNRTQEHIGPQRTALLQSLVNEGKLSWALKESKNILKRRGDGSDEILDESKMAKKKVKRARKDGEEGDEDIEDVIDDALISDFAH